MTSGPYVNSSQYLDYCSSLYYSLVERRCSVDWLSLAMALVSVVWLVFCAKLVKETWQDNARWWFVLFSACLGAFTGFEIYFLLNV